MSISSDLPVPIFGPVEAGSARLTEHVVDVLSAPPGRIGPILIGAHPPLVGSGHRIDWNAPKEFELATRRVVGHAHPFDERLQTRWIAFAAHLELRRRDHL